MDHVAIHLAFKVPGMHLAGYHKIDLVRCYIESFKVDSVCTGAFGKQNQVVKGMFIREVKILVFLQISCKTTDKQIFLLEIRKLADIIYRERVLHDTKIQDICYLLWQ